MNLSDRATLVKWTVYLEAEDQGYDGQVAVAWVIRNRSDKWRQSLTKVCWAAKQFSCWNDLQYAMRRLEKPNLEAMLNCEQAVIKVLNNMQPDPTNGATHYMNTDLVLKTEGKLPRWVASMAQTTKIGSHTFYKEL